MVERSTYMKSLNQFGKFLMLALVLFSFVLPTPVQANDIASIQISATIQENGSVVIRDQRVFYAEEGTEHFISLGNLGDSSLVNFTVYDKDGSPLENIGEWDVNASREEKAGKYGINYAGDEIELCFGFGEYGRREFTIEYEISNFISNLTDDHQAFYWQFINSDMDPINTIEIEVLNETGFEFVNPETRFWAFGHEGGMTEITSNTLTMNSGETFNQSDYVVLLGIFEGTPFATSNQRDASSEDLIDQAMSGATLDGYNYEDFLNGDVSDQGYTDVDPGGNFGYSSLYLMFFRFIQGFAMFALIFGFLFTRVRRSSSSKKSSVFKSTVREDEYYRDVPYEDHFIHTNYLTDSDVSDWISAFILKWVSEGRLEDDVEEVGWIFKKDKLALKIMPNYPSLKNPQEQELWRIVLSAAGDDEILSEKEFNQYVSRNISRFNSWTKSMETQSEKALEEKGYLETTTEKVLGLFNRTTTTITPEGQELGDNIVAFKNYLTDFSLVGEREVSHVQLWQELMVWAAYLGIAEEVYEQLKIADPQFERQMPYSPTTVYMTNSFSRSVRSTQTSANSASTSSSFSGGGGGSFGGGGGGSSGGGSGGGTR